MADDGNIFVVDYETEDGTISGIYLHTLWHGEEWPERLRLALNTPRARERWNDSPYLLRILIDELFADLRNLETGGTVSTELEFSGNHDAIVLDIVNGTVSFAPANEVTYTDAWFSTMSFQRYVDQDRAVYPREVS